MEKNMREVSIIEIDNREFLINKIIDKYYYCTNIKDLNDICILKKEIENKEEIYVGLSDQELEEAIELYKKSEEK